MPMRVKGVLNTCKYRYEKGDGGGGAQTTLVSVYLPKGNDHSRLGPFTCSCGTKIGFQKLSISAFFETSNTFIVPVGGGIVIKMVLPRFLNSGLVISYRC